MLKFFHNRGQTISENKIKGFTLLEIVVVIFIFSFITIMTGSSYLLAQRAYNKGAAESELAQNVRVSLDRLTREIRQANSLVTALPPSDSDPLNPPANEIIFQDGHDNYQITYIRYYLNNGNLFRSHYGYYFSEEPEKYVLYNAIDSYGNSPLIINFSDEIVGEYFSRTAYWGEAREVHIGLELAKNQKTVKIDTAVFSRNQ